MKLLKMKEDKPLPFWGRKFCPLLLLLLVVSLWCVCDAKEDFACYSGGLFTGDKRETGAIIPRGDIIVEVGKETREVLCRFNSTYINNKDVYFATRNEELLSEVVNSTTIRTKIYHFEPKKYELSCKLRKKKKSDKSLCTQIVKAGPPPMNVENMSCISMDNNNVNCTWERPYNPVLTRYHSNFSVPLFMKVSPCPLTDNALYSSWCFWDKSNKIVLRDQFELVITGENEFGTRNYTYRIDIPSIVVPDKISADVNLINPIRAKVTWNLTYPMDVFHFGLYHSVEYRVKGEEEWENVTFFFHKNNYLTLNPNRTFDVETNLPYSYTEYEFRVRIHTGVGEIKESMWSKYDILSIKTLPQRPKVAPETSRSSFEVIEGLEKRVIFVNFKDIDEIVRGGENFYYSTTVYSSTDSREVVGIGPEIVTHAYIKYENMNFTEYRFRIIPANDEGFGTNYSEVVVPHSDCMPKKTEMFTVITSNSKTGKMFSLYWVPSRMPNAYCDGLNREIDSYTIFWCKRTFGNRCKEKLDWMDIKKEDLSIKDLSSLTSANIIIYEKNITNLSNEHLYSFGVAANSGNYSSGIRWSSCIVDDTEPPLPPITEVESLTNDSGSVLVKWSLKCMSISAVPIGFNISYCRSLIEDFGHCSSEVNYVEMNSPTSEEVLISDLNAGGSYIFSVSVLSIIGEGSQSNPKMIKLREDIPAGPPRNLQVVIMSNVSVTLSWDPPSKAQRRGMITEYKITVVPPLSENIVVPAVSEEANILYKLKNLTSFTKYTIFISSCNSKGCSVSNLAQLSFKTLPGVPDEVENFILDVSNWRLLWDLNHCNSRICSFEVQLPVNETEYRIVTVNDKEILSLHEEGIPCNYTDMKFAVRARGKDSYGHFLYSNWTTVLKEESECPSGILSLWIILLVVFICVFLTTVALLIMKFGWRKIMEAIKDCKQNINVPKGIKVSEPKKVCLEEFTTFPQKNSFSSVDESDPPLLLPSTPPRTEEKGGNIKIRADSVSSEEVQLIDSSSEHERHGRNLSGSSDRSSGNDSALMSGCPSLNHNDQLDNLPPELTTFSSQETTLRQRSPGPPYVQHGIIPEKLCEGYVAAWSVPSLPHLYKEGLDNMQQSTPDLKDSMCIVGWQNARRASTGYISMPDSDNDKDSPLKIIRDSMGEISLARMPQRPATAFTALPHYSRHSFSPDVKMDSAKGGYVILAEGRSPSPPSNGYVSAGDPFSNSLKRPPSLPLIPKSFSAGESELPLGAYVKVGSRENSANKGYVSAGRIGHMMNPQDNSNLDETPSYVSCGNPTTFSMSANRNNKNSTTNSNNNSNTKDLPNYSTLFSPYVELKDSGRWAHPVHAPHPPHLNSSTEGGGGRVGRVGPLPRPNTTEATMGHPTLDRNPSLSKQSSGYVSQETIANPEGVLISPKRLMMPSTPHNVAMATNHQASMV